MTSIRPGRARSAATRPYRVRGLAALAEFNNAELSELEKTSCLVLERILTDEKRLNSFPIECLFLDQMRGLLSMTTLTLKIHPAGNQKDCADRHQLLREENPGNLHSVERDVGSQYSG